METLTFAETLLVAAVGMLVVFFGLVLLMCVIMIFGKIFGASAKQKKAAEPVPAPAPQPAVPAATAPGSAGQLKLYNVEPKTAAMIMAIVADKMGKALNELRFLSIKEVE